MDQAELKQLERVRTAEDLTPTDVEQSPISKDEFPAAQPATDEGTTAFEYPQSPKSPQEDKPLQTNIELEIKEKLDKKKQLTFGDRCRMLFCPIKSFKTVYKNGDAETHVIITPEAFRMLFYLYFIAFVIVAIIIGIYMYSTPHKS